MALGKYGILAKKYLKEYKPIKYNLLIIDGTIMEYLYDSENYLKSYANSIERKFKEQCIKPKNYSFSKQVKYNNMIQNIVNEFVKEEIKLI